MRGNIFHLIQSNFELNRLPQKSKELDRVLTIKIFVKTKTSNSEERIQLLRIMSYINVVSYEYRSLLLNIVRHLSDFRSPKLLIETDLKLMFIIV